MNRKTACRTTEMDSTTVQRSFREYEGRDRGLWYIAFSNLIALAAGFGAIVATVVVWGLDGSARYLPYLVASLGALVTFLVIRLGLQRRMLAKARQELLQQLVRVERLVAESVLDPLTGLFNRRRADYCLHREAKRATRSERIFALIRADVIGFRMINERCGHAEGDRLLQGLAGVFRREFRESDTVMRYGDDEFLVLMPDTDEQGAALAVERLVEGVGAWNEANDAAGYSAALGFGVACFVGGDEIEEVVSLAERRMRGERPEPARSAAAS